MNHNLMKNEFNFTIVEWLRLQDYRIEANEGTLLLPGQFHPGLKIGHEVEEMMLDFVYKRKKDGLMNYPDHWYNAYMYFVYSNFHFLN